MQGITFCSSGLPSGMRATSGVCRILPKFHIKAPQRFNRGTEKVLDVLLVGGTDLSRPLKKEVAVVQRTLRNLV